jgi:hypothetical protein
MTRKAFALVAAGSLIAVALNMAAPSGAVGQSAAPSLSSSICTTADLYDIIAVYNFDSPNYRSAESIPQGVKSYLAQLLIGRLNACAALAGQAAARSACTPGQGQADPRTLWEQLKFCEGVLGRQPQERPLIATQEPTFYVLLSIGAPSAGPSSGGGSVATKPANAGGGGGGGGKGGSGPASGSTATGSSVDNPSSFLLFIIAQHLERDVCTRSGISIQECNARHPVAVIPESSWTLEDFRAQCLEDPYVPNDPGNPFGIGQNASAGHGTLGAVVLNGSTVSVDGTFAIFTVYGSSEANYAAQVVTCNSTGGPALANVWSDNISGSNKTTAISFFPLALGGVLLASNATAHEAVAPAPNPSSAPNSVGNFITYQNDVAVGTFLGNTSGLTLGNPSSAQTLRHSFESWAGKFANDLNAFCKLQAAQGVCKALKLPS